jgi:hypothetical protein
MSKHADSNFPHSGVYRCKCVAPEENQMRRNVHKANSTYKKWFGSTLTHDRCLLQRCLLQHPTVRDHIDTEEHSYTERKVFIFVTICRICVWYSITLYSAHQYYLYSSYLHAWNFCKPSVTIQKVLGGSQVVRFFGSLGNIVNVSVSLPP